MTCDIMLNTDPRSKNKINPTFVIHIFLFLAGFALGNIWIHVGTIDSNNVASNIETSINQHFNFSTTLEVPDIYPDDSHIRF